MTGWFEALGFVAPPRQLVAWARRQKDVHAALASCDRADWLLWMLGRCGVDRRTLVGAGARCSAAALGVVPAGERRPGAAVDAALRWSRGEIDGLELRLVAGEADRAVALLRGSNAVWAAIAARSAAETAWRAELAAVAARNAGAALGWDSRSTAPMAKEVLDTPWPACPPPRRLDRCRPALQVAWDLVSEREVPRRLSTAALLDARGLRATLQAAVRHPSPAERELLEALTERIALLPGADGLRDQVIALVRPRRRAG